MSDELEIEQEEGGDEAAAKLKKLKEKIEACRKEKQENLAGWQRCQADFINYRRRQEEQVSAVIKSAGAGVIADILPVLDALEAGIKHHQPAEKERDAFQLIYQRILEILKRRGLEEIKTLDEKFNPEYHEAVEQVESNGKESGAILEVVQKGYLINGKVLRIAKVKVSK